MAARVLAVEDRCWQCRAKVRGVIGVLVTTAGGDRFVPLAHIDRELLRSLDGRLLVARGIGALRHRPSPGVTAGYIANSCVHCDALIGRFRLEDLLADHRARGGSFAQLDIGVRVDLPARDVRAASGLEAV